MDQVQTVNGTFYYILYGIFWCILTQLPAHWSRASWHSVSMSLRVPVLHLWLIHSCNFIPAPIHKLYANIFLKYTLGYLTAHFKDSRRKITIYLLWCRENQNVVLLNFELFSTVIIKESNNGDRKNSFWLFSQFLHKIILRISIRTQNPLAALYI